VKQRTARIPALDRLRGLIMLLMALDHANHFVAQKHPSGEYWGGLFPAYPSGWAFLIRLVTHLAAPGFFFLMGVSIVLFSVSRSAQGWSRGRLNKHFLLRGTVLIGLQLLIVNRAWELSPGGWQVRIYIGVLAALGAAMIICSWLVQAKPVYTLAAGLLLTIGVELLLPNPDAWQRSVHPLLRLLLVPGGTGVFWVNYPLLPWLAVALFGLAFGRRLISAPKRTFLHSLWLGAALLVVFLPLRWLNGFGNLRPRADGGWVGFLNVVKYPPSITFLLLTLGLILMLLWLFSRFEARSSGWRAPLATFGGTPLLFYVLHLFLFAGIGHLFARRGTTHAYMMLYWLLALVLLFPLCLIYGNIKRRQGAASPLRLF